MEVVWEKHSAHVCVDKHTPLKEQNNPTQGPEMAVLAESSTV